MKKAVKIILIVSGVIILGFFAVPILSGIFNIASAVGIVVGILLLLAGAFIERFIIFIKKICSHKIGKRLFASACICAAAVILCFLTALCSTVHSSSSNAENQSTVIVLGCAVYGETPSKMLSSRINAAYNYMVENPQSSAILSGGRGKGEDISEAQCMFNELTEKGIAASRLYIEDKSTNTNENIAFSEKIIEDNSLSREVAISTSDYHLKRATMIAKKKGLNAKRISAASQWTILPVFYVRDTFGVIKEFIFG